MRISHKQKTKMAQNMLTRPERKAKTPIFQSDAWEKRKVAREIKIKKNELGEKQRISKLKKSKII